MAVYLLFIQHILYSLKDDGKAAIIVPTGFLTAQSSIEKSIRRLLIGINEEGEYIRKDKSYRGIQLNQ